MSAKIRVGDVGTVLRVRVLDQDGAAQDLTGATLVMYLRKPDGSVLTKTPTVTTTGTDGRMYYTAVSGDWDAAGPWAVQVKLTYSASLILKSSIGTFRVLESLA